MLDTRIQEQEVVQSLDAPTWSLDGATVQRALPSPQRHAVGPFILLDAFGPQRAGARGLDALPHPHIGLISVSYLLAGSIEHRDSLGNRIRLGRGDLGVTVAGRGVTRSAHDLATAGEEPARGIEAWLALPSDLEECAPSFRSSRQTDLPVVGDASASARVVIGSFCGVSAPGTLSVDASLADLSLAAGAQFRVPPTWLEQAILVVSGSVRVAGLDRDFHAGELAILRPGAEHILRSDDGARAIIFGGAPLDSAPILYWNFASRRSARIDQAIGEWRRGLFPRIAGENGRARLPTAQRHREA